jgi:pimeloyl-ACP methyl ester carboxylesterase
LEIVPHGSHLPHVEAPENFVAALFDFWQARNVELIRG